MSEPIRSILRRTTGSISGTAATQISDTSAARRSGVVVHNSSPTRRILIRLISAGGSSPTITETDKDGAIMPGDTVVLPTAASVEVWGICDSGSSETAAYTAAEVDGSPEAIGPLALMSGVRHPGAEASATFTGSDTLQMQTKELAEVLIYVRPTDGVPYLIIEGTSDGTNWEAITGVKVAGGTPLYARSSTLSSSANGMYAFDVSALHSIRCRQTGGSGNQTGEVTMIGSPIGSRILNRALITGPYSQGTAINDALGLADPIMLGAEARDSDISAHASGDAARGVLSLLGKLVALPYALPGELISGTGSSTGTADTALMAALGAGTRIYVTSIQAANSSATDTLVHIKDGSTTLMTLAVPANGGAEAELPSPLRLTANTALNFASTTAVTTLYVSYQGYQAAE